MKKKRNKNEGKRNSSNHSSCLTCKIFVEKRLMKNANPL